MNFSSNISLMRAPRRALLAILITAVSIVLTLLVMLPLFPIMPVDNLDSSWAYALNEAVARHLVFGRDLVFTFGPLGSVYTWIYHPATDRIMLMGCAIVAAGLCSGFALLTIGRRPFLLILLPFIIVIVQSRDAILMTLPLCLLFAALMVSSSDDDPSKLILTRWTTALFAILVCSIGILPLIKGSFSGMAVALGFLSIVILIRAKHVSFAICLSALTVLSLCFGWVLTGQPISALPYFFIAQKPIIAGYTEAMSSPGPFNTFIYWIIPATICLGAFYIFVGRHRKVGGIIATVGIAAYLFITFKAGFVRADGHQEIAVGALVFLSYTIATILQPRASIIIACIVLAGWVAVEQETKDIEPITVMHRLRDAMFQVVNGVDARMHPGLLDRRFTDAKAEIKAKFPLPKTAGTVDLYPNDLSSLFANDLKWSGRPVLQSYSAYTPELAALNRDHLRNAGPSHIFFVPGAIDKRHPSIEDAASWPDLIANYEPTGFVDQYAILNKRDVPSKITISEPFLSGMHAVGSSVSIGKNNQAVWAHIDVKPTMLGKLVSALYKNPSLYILVRYADGTKRSYRLVPGMTKSGFLLSPTVSNAQDFVSLQSSRADDLLAGKYPVEFGIFGDSGTRWLWSRFFNFSLSTLEITSDTGVDRMLISSIISDNHQLQTLGGNCSIDSVDQMNTEVSPIKVSDKLFLIRGWALVSAKDGIQNKNVNLAFKRPDGTVQIWSTKKTLRSDVASYFHHPELTNVGFEALIDGRQLNGAYEVSVVQDSGQHRLECNEKRLHLVKDS